MKITRVLGLFFLTFTLVFGQVKSFNNVNTLKMEIEEKLYLNDTKKSSYILTYKRPNKIKKEVTAPELNKGEIYIYSEDEKIVYLPFFDQVTREKIDAEEVDIMSAINYIINLENQDREAYKKYKKKKLHEIIVKEGVKIEIYNLKEIDGYLVPEEFVIYDRGVKTAELKIKSYKFNPTLNKEEFTLND